MADDTLSQVAYVSPIVKTRMDARSRYALCQALKEVGKGRTLPATFARHVMLIGLEQLGWTEERMIREYAEYEVTCLHTGEHNPYEKSE